VLPFVLGGALALAISGNTALFGAAVTRWEAALFIGASMSITAFPMLARIIYERGLARTSMRALALAAGAFDDVIAWCMLAAVMACFSGKPETVMLTVAGGALYAVATLGPLKTLLLKIESRRNGRPVSGPMLGFILMLLMLGAWFTDFIRLYAVFGAFIMGTAMPRGVLTETLQRFIEPLTTNFLLPLFFIYSGLNTKLGLVLSPDLWILTLVVVAIACVGKGAGCTVAALCHGETKWNAIAIGALMNSRGLMELILLNAGLERGLITPALFTVMVIMALVTTMMTAPVFEWVSRRVRTLKLVANANVEGASIEAEPTSAIV